MPKPSKLKIYGALLLVQIIFGFHYLTTSIIVEEVDPFEWTAIRILFAGFFIKVKNKIGVDPLSGGNIKMTSNEFFNRNKIFFDLPEALENNFNFPLRFNFKPKKSEPILPNLKSNENFSPYTLIFSKFPNLHFLLNTMSTIIPFLSLRLIIAAEKSL